MKHVLTLVLAALAALAPSSAAQPDVNYSRIDAYVTPFYSSDGPTVDVGRFSKGLGAKREADLLATISAMRKEWDRLTFPELYVAAIRLYDMGYRKESVYWFYTAQYRGRQFAALLDQTQMGSIGSAGFELLQAHNAFYQLTGPYINGYGFGDVDGLVTILERVQKESGKIPDMEAAYSGVSFKKPSEWKSANAELAAGMGKLVAMLKEKKDEIRRQRIEQGVEEQFARLTSKELPRR